MDYFLPKFFFIVIFALIKYFIVHLADCVYFVYTKKKKIIKIGRKKYFYL